MSEGTGQLQNYSVDQAAGAVVLVLGAVARSASSGVEGEPRAKREFAVTRHVQLYYWHIVLHVLGIPK